MNRYVHALAARSTRTLPTKTTTATYPPPTMTTTSRSPGFGDPVTTARELTSCPAPLTRVERADGLRKGFGRRGGFFFLRYRCGLLSTCWFLCSSGFDVFRAGGILGGFGLGEKILVEGKCGGLEVMEGMN
ncbi:hypothetical protein KM043_003584 [Ampulex compressa]|nr:hypothetical protein KM043_003584 [Ampulex compressa]